MRQSPLSAAKSGSAWRWLLVTVIVLSVAGFAVSREVSTMSEHEAETVLGSVDKVQIDGPVVAVRLSGAKSGSAAGRLRRALAGQAKAELVLDGVTVSAPPGVLFNVLLSTTGPAPRREYLGTLSFYGVDRPGKVDLPDRTFDATEQLRALKGKSPELPEIQVVFEATDGTAESTPQKATPSFNPKSSLEVGSIRLKVR